MPSATGWWGSSGAPAPAALDDPLQIRQAGRDLLSLALIDSRNALLKVLAHDESPAALHLAARAGHYQEHWLTCHLQRQRGQACDPAAPRLASIQPKLAAWLAGDGPAPAPETVRGYLAETLEVTLDLLAGTAESDAALHYFRASLLHEDRLGETLTVRAGLGSPVGRALRDAIVLPAQRWSLGAPAGQAGLVPHNERGRQTVDVPACEVDAQPVNWAQYLEFAEDGGYDRPELWTAAGWAWVQDQARRAPRGVEQMRGGVLLRRSAAGLVQRAALTQPVLHVSRHEAQAWCQWAGRRLPTEPEWELAAHRASRQGWVWGDVFEWVAGSARAWPVAGPVAPGELDAPPPAGSQGVLRGASFATRRRWHHPKARRFMPPGHDHAYVGFRSCAI
jgi:hypothetical protein